MMFSANFTRTDFRLRVCHGGAKRAWLILWPTRFTYTDNTETETVRTETQIQKDTVRDTYRGRDTKTGRRTRRREIHSIFEPVRTFAEEICCFYG